MRLVQNAIVQQSSQSVSVCLSYDPVREQTQPETFWRDLVAMLFSDTGRFLMGYKIRGSILYLVRYPSMVLLFIVRFPFRGSYARVMAIILLGEGGEVGHICVQCCVRSVHELCVWR